MIEIIIIKLIGLLLGFLVRLLLGLVDIISIIMHDYDKYKVLR